MAKKNKSDKKASVALGIALIIFALIGIEKIITLLLILLGIYLIYDGLRNR